MECDRLDDETVARYVRGELDAREQERFEDHYFDCAVCLAAVQALQAGIRVLSSERSLAARMPARMRVPAWAMAASVAALAVGALVTLRATGIVMLGTATPAPPPKGGVPPSGNPYAELAKAEPAPYAPLAMRGTGAPDRAFAAAMQKYLQRDFAGAAEGLREALSSGPDTPEVRFYLGVSELMAGRTGAAAETLQSVALSGAEPALVDEARFFRAKALLARGMVAEAVAELQVSAAGSGDRADEARQLLQRIDAARGRSR